MIVVFFVMHQVYNKKVEVTIQSLIILNKIVNIFVQMIF